ncbi:MAG: hypothetical protein ACYCPP_01820 [Nitrososphaerales archaeon]
MSNQQLDSAMWIRFSLLVGALIIGSLSCYLVGSRTTTAYPAVRRILVIAFIAGLVRISLETLKFLPDFQNLSLLYVLLTNILEQVFVILLAVTSIGIYLQSTEGGIRSLLGTIWKHKVLSSFVLSIVIYSGIVSSYIAIEKPYTVLAAKDLWGGSITTSFFSQTLLALIAPNVFILIIGVSGFFFLAAKKSPNKQLKRNLMYLGLSSFIIGIGFLAFTLIQNTIEVDPEDLLYFLLSIMFSSAAVSFNRTSAYAGLLNYSPARVQPTSQGSLQFSKFLRKDHSDILGMQFLLEVDANGSYEKTVIDFCLESLSHGGGVIAVTSKSSALFHSLSRYSGIHFCLFSSSVSRPTPVEKAEGQILIPQDSLLEIVDVLETVLKHAGDEGRIALVLDNLSDRVISIGLERTYKYLKEMLTILAERKVTSLFLLHEGTMDARTLNLLRSLFTNILVSTKDRLTILKE